MGRIIRKLSIRGSKDKKRINVLFDSGASHSIIKAEIAEKLCHIVPHDEPIRFTLVDGTKIESTGSCGFSTTLKDNQSKQKCLITGSAFVLPDFKGTKNEDMIIGVPELQTYGITLAFNKKKGQDRIDLTKCERDHPI